MAGDECRTVRDLLVSYVDGEADLTRRRMIEDHLGRCEDCRREPDQLRRLAALVLGALCPRASRGIRRTPEPDHASGNQLSGGQQRRGALANDPDLLVAGNLDSRLGLEIVALLERLNPEGKPILMVTHSRDLAEHAERISRLLDGRTVRDEEVSERRAAIFAIEEAAG